MMKKRLAGILVVASMAVSLTGCLGSGAPETAAAGNAAQTAPASESKAEETGAAEKKEDEAAQETMAIPFYEASGDRMVIRFASNLTASEYGISPTGIALKTIVDYVEEKSNGSMVVNVYAGSQLASGNDNIVGGVTNGSFEMTNHAAGNWGDYTTAFAPLNVPYLFVSDEVLWEVMDGEVGESMAKVLAEDTNATMLGSIELGMRHMTNNKRQIKTPDDLKGIKLRVQADPIQNTAMTAMGASVVSVSYSELFTALQQGLCDGQENPLSNINSQKFYEVQKYMTLSGHGVTESIIVANTDWLNSLTEEQRTIIEEACKLATENSRTACQKLQQQLTEKIESEGVEVYELTEEEKAAFIEKAKISWPMAEEVMGSERYQQLIEAVEAAEAKQK